tara:strand:+ start:7015 stop:8109 length:1095 start_codon:yes stop_codon:yes gene_type:complete
MSFFQKKYIVLFIVVLVYSCATKKELVIAHSNPGLEYSGRIEVSNNNGSTLFWSGTSIKLNFEGTSIAGLFKDDKGDNYYNIILDQDSISIFKPDTIKQYYQLAKNLKKGKHTIEIFKRTEWNRGKTNFYGFKLEGTPPLLLPKTVQQKRKIEFYGNSITAGYAVEDFSGKDSPDSTYTNNYLSYAAITARHFNAKYHCICRSGIGITVSWFPQIMPEIYDRLNPTNATSKWNFSEFTPDVVVVNLLQNDSWLVNLPDHEMFKMRFGNQKLDKQTIINAYRQFITNLRKHYPKANIICTLGGMDAAKNGSKWIDYIKTATANINDPKIYTHFMPYIEPKGHPSIKGQEELAKSLIAFIEKNITW